MKHLIEKRNAQLDKLDALLNKAKSETRAFDDAELTEIASIKEEIRKIDESIKLEEEVRGIEKMTPAPGKTPEEIRALEVEKEERAFIDLIVEGRASNLPAGTNGSVIPVSIANKIIERVKEISPLYALTTKYDVKGTLNIPAYDWADHTTAYQGAEFTALTESASVFTNVSLQGFVIGTLALISKSFLNRTVISVDYIVNQMAMSISNFIENELINGTVASGKMQGLVTATQGFQGATTLVITPDELVKLRNTVPTIYQGASRWLMNTTTLTYIQTLKDTTGKFLMGNDLNQYGEYVLLGKPIMLSDNMPSNGVNTFPIFYGDFSGLHVKVEQNIETQVLLEKYATQHAVGVVSFLSLDSKVVEPRKIAYYKGK